MKSNEFEPYERSFQVVVQEYKQPISKTIENIYKSGKIVREVIEEIPLRTLFVKAKNGKQAQQKARKYGSVVSCHKSDYSPRLEMIDNLRIEKSIQVDISLDEFILHKDFAISPKEKIKNIDIE